MKIKNLFQKKMLLRNCRLPSINEALLTTQCTDKGVAPSGKCQLSKKETQPNRWQPERSENFATTSKEDILLKTLFNYIVPFLNNDYEKNLKKKIKRGNLENILTKQKSKNTQFEKIQLLEKTILKNFKNNNNIKINKKLTPKNFDFIDKSLIENDLSGSIEEEIKYSLSVVNKKENIQNKDYSISITYEETEIKEKLKVTIKYKNTEKIKFDSLKQNNNNLKNEKIKDYSFSIINKKGNKNDSDKYSFRIDYEDNYQEERLKINYKSTIGAYLNKRQEALHDFSDRVPGKHLNTFPESGNQGLFGYTYLGDVKVWRRADLFGEFAKMVDIHESIHTPNEYETRILTDWIMSKEKIKYIK